MTNKEAIKKIKIHNEHHSKQEQFAIHITEALKMAVEALEKPCKKVELNNHFEEGKKALKEFKHNKMDVQTYNKVFLPQWTNASLFIRNLQLTLEGKCDKESLKQLQIIGWNEETKKFISDVLNLYKEKVLNELSNTSNKSEKEKENTMENYIVINGKKAELTEEQLKQLGIESEKKRNTPFNYQPKVDDSFYYISCDRVRCSTGTGYNAMMITLSNSFNNEEFANQVYLHELLNRKLLKYAWDNEAEDCEWDKDGENLHYYIYFDIEDGYFEIEADNYMRSQNTYFSKVEVARQAIKDVIEPFMKEHPEFVW